MKSLAIYLKCWKIVNRSQQINIDPDRVGKMQALEIAIDAVRKMGKNADCYEGSVTIGIK